MDQERNFSSPLAALKVPGEGNEVGDMAIDDVVGSFSGMRVQEASNKRFMEQSTVEGSPVNAKRLDLQPTPVGINPPAANHSTVTTNPIAPHSITFADDRKGKEVIVLCSASDGHDTGDHQENSLRTALLCGPEGCLRRSALKANMKFVSSDSIEPAPLVDLMRVHEYDYLRHLESRGGSTGHIGAASGPNNPMISQYPPWCPPTGSLDVDTPLLNASLEAAKRFCGAALLAVDYVMQPSATASACAAASLLSSTTNVKVAVASAALLGTSTTPATAAAAAGPFSRVFVLGRPPGHHAGANGCVPSEYYWKRPDMTSSGFCLLNTVAVAAAYARAHYGREALKSQVRSIADCELLLQQEATKPVSSLSSSSTTAPVLPVAAVAAPARPPRIAIVDIDIHHGNGSEDIVRNLRPRLVSLPLPASWAPQTKLVYKPWLDESDSNNVLFSSIQLYAEDKFYPGSGKDEVPVIIACPASAGTGTISCDPTTVAVGGGAIGAAPFAATQRSARKERSTSNLSDSSGADDHTTTIGAIDSLVCSAGTVTPEKTSMADAEAGQMVFSSPQKAVPAAPAHVPVIRPATTSKLSRSANATKLASAVPGCPLVATPVVTAESNSINMHSIPPQIINIALTPVGPGPWDRKKRASLSAQQKEQYCAIASAEFRGKVESMLLPQLAVFKPDLLFISAGFDAHHDDFYHYLTEHDIHWITEQMVDIVEKCGGKGVISILEGGYSLSSAIVVDKTKASVGLGKTRGGGTSKSSTGLATLSGGAGTTAGTGEEKEKEEVHSLPSAMFAQQPGDGGLVKGVLAHAAALAGRKVWC